MRQIATTRKYKKDWELAKRRNLPIEELNNVIHKLANDIPLPKDKKYLALRGDYIGYRECPPAAMREGLLYKIAASKNRCRKPQKSKTII